MSTQPLPALRVRFSLLWKITLPFVFLSMVLGLGATYLVNTFLSQEEADRFVRQLVDSGQQAKDALVRVEIDLLTLERLAANTAGVAESAAIGDAEDLRQRVLPPVLNAREDVLAILDPNGTSVLTIRHRPDEGPESYDALRGETYYSEWAFVQRVLRREVDPVIGDKQADLEALVLGDRVSYVFWVAGPLIDPQERFVGAVLVGRYLNRVTAEAAVDAGANISIYAPSGGEVLSTTLEPQESESLTLAPELLSQALLTDQPSSPLRSVRAAGSEYWEVLTPFTVRQGSQVIGALGISLVRMPLETEQPGTLPMAVRLGAAALILVVLIGLLISSSITRPIARLVEAHTDVALGKLDTRVPESGADEIGALARTFNQMVSELREGSIYRDLLGRTVTPEVRDRLRTSFADGALLLKGQRVQATILFADFRGYTSLAERADPAEVMRTLNDYFAGVVPILSLHGGVVNKFDGDSVMAFFGILPQYLPPRVSALQATHAGVALLEYLGRLNKRRGQRGEPAFEMGIGISTGTVIAGGLGSQERVHYTVVGDTVNVAQRIQGISRQLGGTALVISQDTYQNLGNIRRQFNFGRQGAAQLKGKQREVMVYEVLGRTTALIGRQQVEQTVQQYTGSWDHLAEDLTQHLRRK
jgi:adenylate cyclase